MNMNTEIKKRYCSINELSKYTGLPKTTLYEWASLRVIPSIKIKRRILFDINDIDRIMKAKKRNEIDPDNKVKEILKECQGNV